MKLKILCKIFGHRFFKVPLTVNAQLEGFPASGQSKIFIQVSSACSRCTRQRIQFFSGRVSSFSCCQILPEMKEKRTLAQLLNPGERAI